MQTRTTNNIAPYQSLLWYNIYCIAKSFKTSVKRTGGTNYNFKKQLYAKAKKTLLMEELHKDRVLMLVEVLVLHNWTNRMAGICMTKKNGSSFLVIKPLVPGVH